MNRFDKFALDYEDIHACNVRVSGYDPSYFDERKIGEVARFLGRQEFSSGDMTFLNFGCGIGKSERFVRQYFPRVSLLSLDVSEKSIEVARERNRELRGARFETFDGCRIPGDETFDVVLIANVFHHIPFDRHITFLEELRRHLAGKGSLFIFEHNPLNPLRVRTVRACEFDEDARLLSPWYTNSILGAGGFTWRRINFFLFFPKPLSFLVPFEKWLRKLPLGAQYYYVARK